MSGQTRLGSVTWRAWTRTLPVLAVSPPTAAEARLARVPTTLTGEVERITYESEATSFRVVRVGQVEGKGSVVLVGVFPAVGTGTRVRATGDYVVDSRHGEQFKVATLVPVAPDTLVGLEKYLSSGVIKGIGPAYAKRIVQAFGTETLDVLDNDPGRLHRVSGLGAKRAESIQRAWASQRVMSNVMVLLSTHGASPALAARIVDKYGDRAAQVVQQSPYRLAMEVRGVGFKSADKMAKSLGIAGDHPERAQAGVMHVLGELSDQGHVMSDRPSLVERASQMLEVDAGHVEAAVDALWASGRVVVEDDLVFTAKLHQAESSVAGHLDRLLEAPATELEGLDAAIASFERHANVALAPLQREAIEAAAKRKVVVITGGPGTGKTTIVRAVLSVLDKSGLRVALSAPTGRAAKRLAEATAHEATTIHRLLEFEPRTRSFQRNDERPLDADALIVDEASMVDISLADALLGAVGSAARVVIVGDADQLPSVGPGAFLRDVIASGVVPTVRLDEIFRQASESGIVANAHHILRGEKPEGSDAPEGDFFVIPRSDPVEAAMLIRELVTRRIPQRFGLNPRDDVQVLTPMHRGPAGTIALNATLQEALNPSAACITHRGVKLGIDDKVMQTRNDYEREVFNGDVGVVRAVDVREKTITVRFDENRLVDYEESDLDVLTLAYATSIHKSQGSEYPAVVVPLLTAHFVMLSRNLLYTAVTRAKRLCCLVADPRALGVALGETRREDRMSKLADRLRAAGRA